MTDRPTINGSKSITACTGWVVETRELIDKVRRQRVTLAAKVDSLYPRFHTEFGRPADQRIGNRLRVELDRLMTRCRWRQPDDVGIGICRSSDPAEWRAVTLKHYTGEQRAGWSVYETCLEHFVVLPLDWLRRVKPYNDLNLAPIIILDVHWDRIRTTDGRREIEATWACQASGYAVSSKRGKIVFGKRGGIKLGESVFAKLAS
jgi:hypothetical protein